MKVVKPLSITDSILANSTIPEPDAGEVLWVDGTYSTGEKRAVISTHSIYEVVADPSTTDDPVTGAAKSIPTWVRVSATNRWAMFDDKIGTQSKDGASLIIDLDPVQIIDSLACFNLTGASSVNITVEDATEGVIYDTDIEMSDNSAVTDYYPYFFSPIINKSQFLLTDLPPYPNSAVKVTVGGSEIAIGTLLIGNSLILGTTEYGTGFQLQDYSVVDVNEFGDYTITERPFYKIIDYKCFADTEKLGYVFDILASLRATPAVWQGQDDKSIDPTITYGLLRDNNMEFSNPQTSNVSIQVTSLT